MSERSCVPKKYVPLRAVLVVALLGTSLIPFGCGAEPESSAATDRVNVENAGRTLSFSEAPERVVTMNQNATEMFLALGLEDRMVGTAFKDDPILPRYRDEYEEIPVLSEKYPSLEVLLDVNPDFVYGFDSAFAPPKGPATPERLKQLDITAYVDPMFYGEPGLTLEDVHEEIRRIGRIFRIENRADSLVHKLKSDVRAIRNRIRDNGDTIDVAIYDSGRETMYTAGSSLINDMLNTVNARNVFRDDVDDSWSPISWEKLVKENPEYILVMDYGNVTAEEKIRFLKQKPSLESVKALREDNFVVLPLSTTFVGVRNVQGIRLLAEGLHPDIRSMAENSQHE